MGDRGQARSESRGRTLGGRIRNGAACTALLGGILVGGGAASFVVASAHTGTVATSQDCNTWTASVALANNVTSDRFVDVVTTIPGTTGLTDQHFNTTGNSGDQVIWSKNGAAITSGTVTLNIYKAATGGGKGALEFTQSSTLPTPEGCMSSPTISTKQSAGGVIGTVIHDTATVHGGNNPTGDVTFKLYPPADATCAGTAVFTSTNALVGTLATSGTFKSAAVGTYRWVATYNGDSKNHSATSACSAEQVVITRSGPAITTNPSAGGQVGIAIHDSATVTGRVNPASSDTVTFKLYGAGDTSCAAAPVATSVVALPAGTDTVDSPSFTTTAVGTYSWVADYSGDANNSAAASACGAETAVITQGTPPPTGGQLPNTGAGTAVTALSVGGFLLLGGLGVALLGLMPARRRENS